MRSSAWKPDWYFVVQSTLFPVQLPLYRVPTQYIIYTRINGASGRHVITHFIIASTTNNRRTHACTQPALIHRINLLNRKLISIARAGAPAHNREIISRRETEPISLLAPLGWRFWQRRSTIFRATQTPSPVCCCSSLLYPFQYHYPSLSR